MLSDAGSRQTQQSHAMPASTSPKTEQSATDTGGAAAPAKALPPPKTDKPRPHTCATCQRSFARLEHLKRHERSHTKEKPFECPECSRCFARRDLLLRHQQKLHMTTTPSSRPRNRRESTSSTMGGPGRVRKASVVNGTSGSMRPRANTISHVDGAQIQLLAAANATHARQSQPNGGHSHHPSLTGLPMQGDYPFGGMSSMGQRGVGHGLSRLETHGFDPSTIGSGLRTAPVGFNGEFDFEGLLFGTGPGSTINPNALHYSDSPHAMAMDATAAYQNAMQDMVAGQGLDENFDWMNGFEQHMTFDATNENAIDESSPSAMSTTSQSGISEVMLDGSNNPAAATSSMWQQSMMAPPLMTPNFNLDLNAGGFPDLLNGAPLSPGTVQPKNPGDQYFSTPPPSLSAMSPSVIPNFNQSLHFGPETPTSISGSMPSASPTATITDATRQALVAALAQCHPFGARKYSFPQTSSPLSPRFAHRSMSTSDSARNLPSTPDLQRYVAAFIRYFHPHLPFLHIPTLSFEIPAFPQNNMSGHPGTVGGQGCLILSMAAIGALYEMEHVQSKELFESAKKMIQLYLEERRKADMRKADFRKTNNADAQADSSSHTPVWLVQAMLLNLVYGHNCGDKTAGDIANTHSAALVGLARAAELLKPSPTASHNDIAMMDDDSWSHVKSEADEHAEWLAWKTNEERKRTLYAVFILSSLLVSAYNHTPALTNSEVLLDLPCDEEFFAAESATKFFAKGGPKVADHNRMTFHDALGELLRTSEKQQQQQQQQQEQQQQQQGANPPFGSSINHDNLPTSDLRPSTFGCLVLINALHNYIWETRQRHHAKVWTNEETEKMHHHIEPALKAWQAAWATNPQHSLERPNPFGQGPLSADSVPLLDLAYVRLFVNLSRSKEKFWQRDYDGMAEELSRGSEIIQHAEQSPNMNSEPASLPSDASSGSLRMTDSPPTSTSSPDVANREKKQTGATTTSKRERHLRKAAFYAADSLAMSDKLGVTFADFTSRELPLQSALCAFDCAQVLAEWVATVQDRIGRFLGVLGKDDIDLSQVPGILLLEEEDCKLILKIQEVLHNAELKMTYELTGLNGFTTTMTAAAQRLPSADNHGYASKILRVTAYMLDKAAVWPVTRLMARSLETQAKHMRNRAENSVLHRE